MMRDRVVVPVGPVPDRSQHTIGVEIERIGAAAELGRQQRDPFAEAASADVGLGVDQFTDNVVALGFGISGAGVLSALIRNRAGGFDPGISDRRGLASDRRSGDNFEEVAAVELRLWFLGRLDR